MIDRWATDLSPGAEGWLGTTAGRGRGRHVLRRRPLRDTEHARANSERPEQHAWWMETAKLFEGEVTFADCTGVEQSSGPAAPTTPASCRSSRPGSPTSTRSAASAVGSTSDLGRRAMRDDVIGGLSGIHDGDRMVQVVYFTSEEAAPPGESRRPPPEVAELMAQEQSLMSGTTFTDLAGPVDPSRGRGTSRS